MKEQKKSAFKPVSSRVSFPTLDEELIRFWRSDKTFEASVEQRSQDKAYVFYDGPPFVTGLPHYGSLLSSIAKDVIPRYQTMRGHRVERVWGWDCHGLPIEEKTEKKLGLKNRRDIEKVGVKKFINECRQYVSETSAEWNWYIDHIGRWVDMDHAYRTMDLEFMESAIWAFKQLYDKGLVYQGLKTLLYCTRCGTPVSKFEIAMDDSYRLMEDPAITVKFPVKEGRFEGAAILAWTTTPWTLPANRALVVDEEAEYVLVKVEGEEELLILAKARLESILADRVFEIQEEFLGSELVGAAYEPPYRFFSANEKDLHVYFYQDMVNMEEGTGIVHSAPGFGEIDTEMGQALGLTLMFAVDDEGKFVKEVEPWAGVYVKEADEPIMEDLQKRGLLFKREKISHRYPYCYRCETPLIYRSVKAWFVNIQQLKDRMLALNNKVNWVPKHFKKGRFGYTVKEAPDWCVSRTRYWATVMPIWRCEKCEALKVVGSIKEIEENAIEKVKITDLHRTGVDQVEFRCPECEGKMKRVPEVLDVWFESGSMPYGERHYPFENKEAFEKAFPGDFIVEYVAQIRAWFYYLHTLSTALFDSHCFKNVIVTGVIGGTDGRKMSKSYGNYPDPKEILQKHGGDALRLYLMGSVLMLGRDMAITKGEEIENQVKQVLLPFWNSYKYLVTFANLHQWHYDPQAKESDQVLDKWIAMRAKQFSIQMGEYLDHYEIPPATALIREFVEDLSRWYIRRSRERFNQGDPAAMATLYQVLVQFCLTAAPIIPFITESIFKDLTGKRSVHLEDWPEVSPAEVSQSLLDQMRLVREVCSLGHAIRKEKQIKVRQPLSRVICQTSVGELPTDLLEIIKDELNVKEVVWEEKKGLVSPEVELDLVLTPALEAEGEARELIRQIQDLRKQADCRLDERIKVFAPNLPQDEVLLALIKEKTLAEALLPGETVKIERS